LRDFLIFKIVTLFPEFYKSPLESGLLGKAVSSGLIRIEIIDLRDYTGDKFKRCDDSPYGGGTGMVLKPEPLFKALESIGKNAGNFITAMAPAGEKLDQELVKKLSQKNEIVIICGHYEGIDQRVIDKFVDLEISIGDYILSGGEFASLVIIDAVSRLIPGFMSNEESVVNESFENYLIEYPQYTRPEVFQEMAVPEVLLSGDHEKIAKWRLDRSIERTKNVRPDLYKKFLINYMSGESK
jgi:tRNA (guanine37-N1)-methyltransferase